MKHIYDDIRHLPHPVSKVHPPMSRHNRAAQFAPFAALVGHDAAVAEAARLTERRIELDEHALNLLDYRFQVLVGCLDQQPTATVTYFEEDARKDGGAYRTVTGSVQGIADQHITVGETAIPLCDVMGLILEGYEE